MARRDPDGSGRFVTIPDSRISEEWTGGARRFRCTVELNGVPCSYVNTRNSNVRHHLTVAHHIIPDGVIEELVLPGAQHLPENHAADDQFLNQDDGADQHNAQDGGDVNDMVNADDIMAESDEEVVADLAEEPALEDDGNVDAGEIHLDLGVPNPGVEDNDRWPEQLVQMFARRQHLSDVGVQMLSEIINVVRLVNRPLDPADITNRSRDQVNRTVACRSCGAAANVIRRACSTAGCSG